MLRHLGSQSETSGWFVHGTQAWALGSLSSDRRNRLMSQLIADHVAEKNQEAKKK